MAQISSPTSSSARGRKQKKRGLKASAARRRLLALAFGGLLTASSITLFIPPERAHSFFLPSRWVSLSGPERHVGFRSNNSFDRVNKAMSQATRGDCLTWPDNDLNAASIVACTTEHKFEVAESIDMRVFPGSEYGPDAPPPSDERIEQITQEQCETTVRHYLGTKFDPHGKFIASMLWSGDQSWVRYGERRILCGLQLPGTDNQQLIFTGKVADIDQSNIWPAGTCLGIDEQTNQPNDIPVDCSRPHAKEVTGSVNLAEQFPEGLPSEEEQDDFIKNSCARITKEYLDPVSLRNTTLTLTYATLSLPSWLAGSREVACSIGTSLGDGRWAPLVNSARGELLINGQPPVPPSEIPPERLNLLPDYG